MLVQLGAALSDSYALIKIMTHQVPSLPIDVVVNRTWNAEEGPAAFERLALAADHFLRRSIGFPSADARSSGMDAARDLRLRQRRR